MAEDREIEQQTIRRYRELAERARQSGVYAYTSFHSPAGAALAYRAADEREITMWGGAKSCERVVIRFGDPQEIAYEEAFPIRILHAESKQAKYAEKLTHRDFLGAILNLGIERDLIGDIFVSDSAAYIFVLEEMADYVMNGLERVKHTAMKCSLTEEVPADHLPKLCEESITVASPRLDAVLAKVYHLSRGEAKDLFDAEKVFVNGRTCKNPETELKDNCKVSVRGYGKMEYRGEMHVTKKDKFSMTVWRYV
ncbi:MAG: DbpA RNA binding domain-containing protein [Lachnospiraceae bacterium]|nr:DbpA RNA binding domain-containing protein [Lachnospiraceae bacterium]